MSITFTTINLIIFLVIGVEIILKKILDYIEGYRYIFQKLNEDNLMLIKVYHASPSKIDCFEIPFNGLHFGTKHSALQAVERKCKGTPEFWLHEVLLDTSYAEDVFDSGDSWREDLQQDLTKLFSYTNKYEPSAGKSYVMFDTSFIKEVISITNHSLKDFSDYLEENA